MTSQKYRDYLFYHQLLSHQNHVLIIARIKVFGLQITPVNNPFEPVTPKLMWLVRQVLFRSNNFHWNIFYRYVASSLHWKVSSMPPWDTTMSLAYYSMFGCLITGIGLSILNYAILPCFVIRELYSIKFPTAV